MTTEIDLALIKSAAAGNLAEASTLLGRGANVNAEDVVRDSALNAAAAGGHLEVARRLLEAGANVEHPGGADLTPLMNAAVSGHVDMVRLLLASGARVSNDLLNTIQLKVNILEENAEAGMVLPQAVASWKAFLDFLVAERIWQDLPQLVSALASQDRAKRIAALDQLSAAARYPVSFESALPALRALAADADEQVSTKASALLQLLAK